MQSPFKHYLGGKGSAGTFQKIINEIPPHVRLIIPFAGNCAVTRYISPALNTVLFDLDPNVVNSWRVALQNSENKSRYHITIASGIEYLKENRNSFDFSDVIYCDPPYPLETRSSITTVYDYDMVTSDHLSLLLVLLQLNCPVLISTYPNKLYSKLLAGWRLKKYYGSTRKGKRLEYLYMNFDNPDCFLHDYSYAGKNFRDRERIKKKVDRFTNKLLNMPPLDRNAILSEISGPISGSGDGVRENNSRSFGINLLCSTGGNGDDKNSRDPITGNGVAGSKMLKTTN